jgi:P4 family phage/plasmid primase-like protien
MDATVNFSRNSSNFKGKAHPLGDPTIQEKITHFRDNVPAELKNLRDWVVWKTKNQDTGKPGKVPYNALTGLHAKSNDPNTWATFDEALDAFSRGGWDGISVALTDGIAGVDLDDCLDENGEPSETAQKILNLFRGAYSEISPSRRGLHIFCKGKPPRCGKGTKDKSIEVYDESSPRFLTFTGNKFQGSGEAIVDMQPALDILHKLHFLLPEPIAANDDSDDTTGLSDDEVLKLARSYKHRQKFRDLYDDGNWQAHYDSQSEADLGLCSILAFFTGRDREQIDRLFRESKLYRKKWDEKRGRDTYGRMTVEAACKGCKDVYEPRNRGQQTRRRGNPPQSDMARGIESELTGNFEWDVVSESWMFYGVGYWMQYSDTEMLREVEEAVHERTDNGYEISYIRGVEAFLRLRLPGTFTARNEVTHIPFQNGDLELSTGKLVDWNPARRLMWQLPFRYDPGADCGPVLEWLDEATGGDKNKVTIIRAFFKATICGRADLQIFLTLLGPGGSGKGTILRLLTAGIGESNRHSTTLDKLENNRFETANLYQKQLVLITDSTRFVGRCDTLKAMTGGDALHYEQKFKQAGEPFTYNGMVAIAANEAVQFNDHTSGLQRRQVVVNLDNPVDPDARRDLDTEFKPYLPGVINWALEMSDEEMKAALLSRPTGVYLLPELAATNPIAAWAADNLFFGHGSTPVGVKKIGTDGRSILNTDTHLYPNFCNWCRENGHKEQAINRFVPLLEDLLKTQLKMKNIERVARRDGKFFTGISLEPRPSPDDPFTQKN